MPRTRNRDVIRMACRVQQTLFETRPRKPPLLPEAPWRECQRLSRLLQHARNQGWTGAEQRIQPRFTRALGDFKESLDPIRSEQLLPVARKPTLREIHHDLQGLIEEFPNAELDLRDDTIAVVTDSLILEDVYLGPFRIELSIRQEPPGLSYAVDALDPHPAAQNEEVTHPHVQHGQLCEGEGRLPIQNALRDGRLTDFFQIVNQILETYNPASPYVALSDWHGLVCSGCGAVTCDEERTSCTASGVELCLECAVTCPDCDSDYSIDFTSRCDTCKQRFCDRCLEGGLCHVCQQEIQTEETPISPPVHAGPGGGGAGLWGQPAG